MGRRDVCSGGYQDVLGTAGVAGRRPEHLKRLVSPIPYNLSILRIMRCFSKYLRRAQEAIHNQIDHFSNNKRNFSSS